MSLPAKEQEARVQVMRLLKEKTAKGPVKTGRRALRRAAHWLALKVGSYSEALRQLQA